MDRDHLKAREGYRINTVIRRRWRRLRPASPRARGTFARLRISAKILLCFIALSVAGFPVQAQDAKIMGNDVERLAKLIHLPARPNSVRWMLTPLGEPGPIGPTDYSLVALLDYDDATCEMIAHDSHGEPAMVPSLSPEEVADWLPAELHDRLVRVSNGYYRIEGTAFAPALFAHGSFLVGYAVRIERTNLLLVALSTD